MTENPKQRHDNHGNLIASVESTTVKILQIGVRGSHHILTPKNAPDFSSPNAKVLAMTFHPDAPLMAIAFQDGTVQQWDLTTGSRNVFDKATDLITTMEYSPDGSLLALGGTKGSVRVFDTANGQEIHHNDALSEPVKAVRFSSKEKLFAAAAGKILTQTTLEGRPATTRHNFTQEISDIRYSSDGQSIELAMRDCLTTISVEDLLSGRSSPHTKESRIFSSGHARTSLMMCLSPCSKYLATNALELQVIALSTGRALTFENSTTIDAARKNVLAMSYAQNHLATVTKSEVTFWKIDATGVRHWCSFAMPVQPEVPCSIAVSSQGHVAVGFSDGSTRFLEVQAGQELPPLKHSHEVTCIKFSQDPGVLACACTDGQIYIWLHDKLKHHFHCPLRYVNFLEWTGSHCLRALYIAQSAPPGTRFLGTVVFVATFNIRDEGPLLESVIEDHPGPRVEHTSPLRIMA